MTIDLNDMLLFGRVVEAGGFSAAARELGMHKQSLSRRIAELEQALEARLLQRSTRRVHLTEVGEQVYVHARELARHARLAEQAAREQGQQVQGLLRVVAPPMLGEHLIGPIIREFLAGYPEVRVELRLSDARESLIEAGVDVAIRVGQLDDSSLVAQRLGCGAAVCCASPGYLASAPPLTEPAELADHRCLTHECGLEGARWTLERAGEHRTVEFVPALRCSSVAILIDSVLAGLGVARLPRFACREAIAAGRLAVVLPEWSTDLGPICAVYPSRKHVSAKLRAFLELLRLRLPEQLEVSQSS